MRKVHVKVVLDVLVHADHDADVVAGLADAEAQLRLSAKSADQMDIMEVTIAEPPVVTDSR
jgi:hypothetical protein